MFGSWAMAWPEMVVMSVEAGSDQAVFVNIVGDIDPEQIGRIGQKFQIKGMREL